MTGHDWTNTSGVELFGIGCDVGEGGELFSDFFIVK